MKNIILFLFITINVFSKSIETKNNFKDIIQPQPTIAEVYYNRLEVSTRLPYFTNRFIDRKANERPDVPVTVWQTIKDNLDYTSFKISAIQVLNNNFTSTQMQQTITKYQDKPYIPILTLKLREELQLAGLEFDIVVLNQINNILVANGHQPIQNQ
ncbi:hypothetical protein [Flavobacterium chungangense]|uniref:Uncharacterized protein n=1 Tax=Flavobacterium chungangense TaxID=554283 RepID=A0A6V6YU83_9FLAO|nr:hypothetical protein [Flavobacterium chungangense]CAD0002252.1 hypothetical protein FLACHUCJ7_00908 [Flavobacterium chungangense]